MSALRLLFFLVLILVGYLVFLVLNRRDRGANHPRTTVTIDSDGIVCTYPDGESSAIRWDELWTVEIQTTDEGPWLEDVFFVLYDSSEKPVLVVPQEAVGSQDLLVALQELPEYDDDAVIRAMGCTSNQNFRCWRGSVKGDPRESKSAEAVATEA